VAAQIHVEAGRQTEFVWLAWQIDAVPKLDHVLPRSRGGRDEWENLVWSDKAVNSRKGNRLPHETGLKLLHAPRAPKELPVTALLRNVHGIAEWKLFMNE
jgi:HNH endonuclease